MKHHEVSGIEDIEFAYIRNKNEDRVLALMPSVLAEHPEFSPNRLDYEDIYALTLNNLPPRYVQHVNIVLNEPVTDELILEELRKAVAKVIANPNH